MKSLFWRIYLTILICLLAFGAAAFWLADQRIERAENRLAGWQQIQLQELAEAAQERLPAASAPLHEQARALHQLSREMRRPLALADAQGNRIAESRSYQRRFKHDDDHRHYKKDKDRQYEHHKSERNKGERHKGERHKGEHYSGSEYRKHKDYKQKYHKHTKRPRIIKTVLPDGRILSTLRPPPPDIQHDWTERITTSMGALMLLISVAIALVAYPVARRMSARFKGLERSMHAFGSGELNTRARISGKDEAARMAHSFNRMADRIQQLVGSHKNLLATASHELRSPLTRLQMAASLFTTAAPAQRPALQEEIEANIRELNDLIEEILLSSKLDAQTEQPTLTRTDLCPLLQALVQKLIQQHPRVELLGTEQPLHVMAHPKLLTRAIRNLIENALRYSDGTVTVQLTQQHRHITIHVIDTGDGIPPEQRDNIFKPFFRLPQHAEHQGGTGLGLALVRQIAELHDAGIVYEPNQPTGCVFRLTLPSC